MLTQEQARGLNIQQHELEDAELQQAKAQQSVDKYYNAMKVAMDSYDTLSPEKQAKVKALLPELQKGYEDAKNKRAYEEDRYRQALNKINEYNFGETVYRSQIETVIGSTPGEISHVLAEPTVDTPVSPYGIAVLGTITYGVTD